MIHRFQGGTLKIEQFRRGMTWVGVHDTYTKTLVVEIPAESELDKLTIDAAAVEITLVELNADSLELDTASGSCEAIRCSFDRIDVDTAATKLNFIECTSKRIDVDCASGSISLGLLNMPDRIDLDLMSGSCQIMLPEDASFQVDMDSLSGNLDINGFSVTEKGKKRIVNGGDCHIDVDMMSGSVTIEPRTQPSDNSF